MGAEGPMGAGGDGRSPFLLLKDPTNYTHGENTHVQREQKVNSR